MTGTFYTQAFHQQSSSETEEGRNMAYGSSEGEEGDSVEKEDDKEKLQGDKTGAKRKKTTTSKVLQLVNVLTLWGQILYNTFLRLATMCACTVVTLQIVQCQPLQSFLISYWANVVANHNLEKWARNKRKPQNSTFFILKRKAMSVVWNDFGCMKDDVYQKQLLCQQYHAARGNMTDLFDHLCQL